MLKLVHSLKICGGPCGQELPATTEFFCRNPMGAQGLHSTCRECTRVRNREAKAAFRSDHPEEARAIGREEQRKQRLRRGVEPIAEKRARALSRTAKPCSICRVEKRLSAFQAGSCIDGRASECRVCTRAAVLGRRDQEPWYSRLLSHAKERHLKMGFSVETFDLTREWLERQFAHQEGRCAWFNVPMTLARKSGLTQASIDRVDGDAGYTSDNVILVCKSANLARNAHSAEEFETFINLLAGAIVGRN